MDDILSGTFGIVVVIFSFVLFLLWFLLPFAVFGIKGRLDQLIKQNKKLISLLQDSDIEPATNSVGNKNEESKEESIVTSIEPKENA